MVKKGASQIWWIIIAAVIALVVVVIVLSILTGRIGVARSSFMDCASKGGYCQPNPEQKSCSQLCRSKGETSSPLFTCPDEGATSYCCCLSLKKGVDEACTVNSDCQENLQCQNGKCQSSSIPTPYSSILGT